MTRLRPFLTLRLLAVVLSVLFAGETLHAQVGSPPHTDFDDLHEFTIIPVYHASQLPEPLAKFNRHQLLELGPSDFVSYLAAEDTLSAWIRVPDGRALELFKTEGFGGQFALGVVSASALVEQPATPSNELGGEIPNKYLYLSQHDPDNTALPYKLYLAVLPDSSNANGASQQYQHLALFNSRVLSSWIRYDDAGQLQLLFPSIVTTFNRPLFGSFPEPAIESQFPILRPEQFAGEVTSLAFYPGLLSERLVHQLASEHPFLVPEPLLGWPTVLSIWILGGAIHRRR